ncbi:MAG: hypothetical protein M1820_007855 [Bogoriella megaspora]|nr:MAG: hypothetical protein M1820_007855 [Bogoriella megaspora]
MVSSKLLQNRPVPVFDSHTNNKHISETGTTPESINMKALRKCRQSREFRHNTDIQMSIKYCPRLSTTFPDEDLSVFHLQDCMNKQIPIFYTMSGVGVQDHFLYEYSYKLWFQGTASDIEFRRFPVKVFKLTDPSPQCPVSIDTILNRHRDICDQVLASGPLIEASTYETPSDIGMHRNVNRIQREYFRLQPAFQKYVIVIDSNRPNIRLMPDTLVHVLCTEPSGPAGELLYTTLAGRFSQHTTHPNAITTNLSDALEFAIFLDRQEPILNSQAHLPPAHDNYTPFSETAKIFGYTGPEPTDRSSTWTDRDTGFKDLIKVHRLLMPLPQKFLNKE